MLHRSHDLGDDDKPKRGFPPSFDQLRMMGNTPPVSTPPVRRTLDPERAAAGVEAARSAVQQLQAVERFHRHAEQAASTAFRVMLEALTEGDKGLDLTFVEPEVMERVGKAAWAWGVAFAEARNPAKQ
jgi:hypothetical protein